MDATLESALDAIDVSTLGHDEWLRVGMALHKEGFGVEVWDAWSARDTRPKMYRRGECERRWRSFGRSSAQVGGGTIVAMAKERGWSPSAARRALSWDDKTARKGADGTRAGGIPPGEQLKRYLLAVFEPDDKIGYVADSIPAKDGSGRRVPAGRGCSDRTRDELIEAIDKYEGDIARALGVDGDGGAWIRVNPLDGCGVGNRNVTAYRNCLVECDELDKKRQLDLLMRSGLPIAALVDSGGKSVHAIVRIGAKDEDEYRARVKEVYDACEADGLPVDRQNANPSRLSRLPGAMRGDACQRLISTDVGAASYEEWKGAGKDALPAIESLSAAMEDMPPLAPQLIDGVLRLGHKMLLAGPSKAGKSFCLIELCTAVAAGGEWLGFGCRRGRVLYMNLELDRASCLHRFHDVLKATGRDGCAGMIDVWNLRGRARPISELAPEAVARLSESRPSMVVIDPIYKVSQGDENSASDVAAFCRSVDSIATGLGCAVVYAHHHSKGLQAAKKSQDRASGSGVFARDPDAIIDLIELSVPDEVKDEREDEAVIEAVFSELERQDAPVGDISLEDANLALSQARSAAYDEDALLASVVDARRASRAVTAWQAEATLREFRSCEPVRCWFQWPLHIVSSDLADLLVEGSPEWAAARVAEGREIGLERSREAKEDNDLKRREEKVSIVREALAKCASDGVEPTVRAVLERVDSERAKAVTKGGAELTARTLKSWCTPAHAAWTPFRMVAAVNGKPGLIVDSEAEGQPDGACGNSAE